MCKLYVVGTDSEDPKTWSAWDEYSLVVADNPNQARKMCGKNQNAYEVSLEDPKVLLTQLEPNL